MSKSRKIADRRKWKKLYFKPRSSACYRVWKKKIIKFSLKKNRKFSCRGRHLHPRWSFHQRVRRVHQRGLRESRMGICQPIKSLVLNNIEGISISFRIQRASLRRADAGMSGTWSCFRILSTAVTFERTFHICECRCPILIFGRTSLPPRSGRA